MTTADMVLVNGRIHTLDPQQPTAEAIAIRDGRITAVGTSADLRPAGRDGRIVDLDGAVVIPGLVDAHVHFQWYALSLQQVDVYELPTKAEAVRRVADHLADRSAGKWITGRGWKNELWPDTAFPTAADLDTVTPENPVLLRDKSGHAAWANTRALQTAGIDANTPDPPGGHIQRDESGRATGMLFETAIDLVRDTIPPHTPAEIAAAMRQAQAECWRVGLTGVHDFDGPTCFRGLQTLHRAGELGLRIYKNIPARYLDHAVALGLRTDFGDEWLRIGGVKIFADGALGAQTALMIDPYEGGTDNVGIAVTDKEEMYAIASKAAAHELSVTVHAIGDKAVHDVLDVYAAVRAEEAARGQGRRLRHRIEHVQVYHPADRDRLAELDVIASMQPTHATSDMEMADRYWGERAKYSYAWRDMKESGAPVVFGSDCPVEAIDPLRGIYAAVTRRKMNGSDYAPDGWYPQQTFTMQETIEAFTVAAAQTAGLGDKVGRIRPGMWADLTVLDRDLWTIDPEEILQTQVVGTMTGGVWRYFNG